MKKYHSLGELLIDYRIFKDLSQIAFATDLGVDIRTIQRWEKDATLVKPEKEEEIVNATFLPYQLIRNLNAAVPIPTFYDFILRKYSLNEIDNELPDAHWFKDQMEIDTERIRTLDVDQDLPYIKKFMEFHKDLPKNSVDILKASVKIIPQLNLIITDDSGYYSGHSIVLPISEEAYKALKNKEIEEDDLALSDIVDYKKMKTPIFFGFEVTADCNDHIFYLYNRVFRFFNEKLGENYHTCFMPIRQDSYEFSKKIGLKLVWEEEKTTDNLGDLFSKRFVEGNFAAFLNSVD